MPTGRKTNPPAKPQRPPATTPEGRENQLVALAMDVAEKQMREGTASSQVITEFLKLGSSRGRLERIKLAQDNELTQARIEAMASHARMEEVYKEALVAMRSYAGQEPPEPLDDYED